MLWVAVAVFVAVLAALAVAAVHGSRNRSKDYSSLPSDSGSRAMSPPAVGLTVIVLIALLTTSVWTGRGRAKTGNCSYGSIVLPVTAGAGGGMGPSLRDVD